MGFSSLRSLAVLLGARKTSDEAALGASHKKTDSYAG